ncbi:type III-A CRISPR-associated RAMP protein Csm3 [Fusobacterium hominis]|uniref:type III-A CRISPR-associated RAMP protein Csm3 n=1 Tax=Fusobacterium hominis TaxID=2764326 RepID=UPI0015A08BA9|nr:type III-A CRISPR-associated RAMP protein Csm3 [Fusobacterium hominis]
MNNYAKIEISGTIEIVTGMHIGGNNSFSAIGAVDSPIIKDIRSGNPIIPGSSLKGKMRTLLAKQYNKKLAKDPNEDNECIKNLFGSSEKGNIKSSRLIFSDSIMENWDELKERGLTSKTEIKFENTINRLTAVANPRQIERTIRGSKFPLNIIYEIPSVETINLKETVISDFEIIKNGLKLLQYDYLGGNGTRGYGKIKFYNIILEPVIGDVDQDILEECQNKMNEFKE